MTKATLERVVAYVDGFNLYFGLRDSKLQKSLWLNVCSLISNILQRNQQLTLTKYFTSRISGPPPGDTSMAARRLAEKRRRQLIYFEALDTLKDLNTFYGHYLDKPMKCFACGGTWLSHEEKMTDVNIATEMLTDAFEDRFDTAILVSADSDLVAPIEAVRRLFPAKRVVVAFPPARASVKLKKVASAWLTIGRRTIRKSQFPDRVVKPDGFVLERPATWR